MRIELTSLEENKHIEEITEIVKKAFAHTNYSIKVIPSRYEKHSEEIKDWHRNYYKQNRERLVQEQRDRRARKKVEQEKH